MSWLIVLIVVLWGFVICNGRPRNSGVIFDETDIASTLLLIVIMFVSFVTESL